MFYLSIHSIIYYIYGYIVDDPIQKAREESHFMGYCFRLAVKDILYAPSHSL